MHERVHVIILVVLDFLQETQGKRSFSSGSFGHKLVGICVPPPDYNLAPIGQQLVGGVPPRIHKNLTRASIQDPDFVRAIGISPCLHQGAVCEELPRAAPCICEDR